MSRIMQRRAIILYETLEALYQQVNAPFCAQRRPQRPALGGARPGPGAYRPAGGAAAPGGGHGPAGFTSRPDMLSTMNVCSNLEKAGIVVATAAGNEYTAAYKNLWENDNCKALEQVYFLGNPPENVSTKMFVSKVADMTVYYDAALAAQWAPEGETT